MADPAGVWRVRRCPACGRPGNALVLLNAQHKLVRAEMRCKYCGIKTLIYDPSNDQEAAEAAFLNGQKKDGEGGKTD